MDAQLAQSVDESPYYGPIKQIPASFSDADKARLAADYRATIDQGIYPAYRRLRNFLKNDYLPKARETVGLSSMKGGAMLYKLAIENTTTLPLDAETIHQTGLSEVTRIKGEMEKVRQEVGFTGTLPEFFDYLRNDPKFKKESRDALTQGYYEIGKQVDQHMLHGTFVQSQRRQIVRQLRTHLDGLHREFCLDGIERLTEQFREILFRHRAFAV